MNVNKTIHESILVGTPMEGDVRTEHVVECGEIIEIDVYPNYTDPVHYCELMDWMREDGRNWKLRSWVKKDSGCCDMDDWMDLDTIGQVTLIAEAIEAEVFK